MTSKEYLTLLIENGRKYTSYSPGYTEAECMTEIELQEMAGYLLNESMKNKYDLGQELVDMLQTQDYRFAELLADYCIDDSPNKGDKLLDFVRAMTWYHYEFDIQVMLTAAWEEKEVAKYAEAGYIQAQHKDNGETYWAKRIW